MSSFMSFTSNPIWRARQSFLYHGEAHAPTLWSYDANGYASPSGGRSIGATESAQLSEYNTQRASVNAENRALIDNVMSRAFPLTDSLFNPMSGFDINNLISNHSWLKDHEQGGHFYNDSSNYSIWPDNMDGEAGVRLGRLKQLLQRAGINLDLTELDQKVESGITSPIVIDLDGDGIETSSLFAGHSVMFDIDGDGKKDQTGWLSGRDAFLAVDKNGNGVIDGVGELFGGPNRGDGYAQLATFDSNGDGKVDSNDERYSELLVWQDKNIDGVTDATELRSASSVGLESVSVNYTSQEDVYNNGNLIGEVSTAVINGEEVGAADVYFRFKPAADSSKAPEVEPSVAALVAAMSTFSVAGPVDSLAVSVGQLPDLSLAAAAGVDQYA